MADYRRTARELALRVLFQADVGRQPVRIGLQGALEQLAAGVASGLTMALRQFERRFARGPRDAEEVLTPKNVLRERARVRRNAIRQITACRDALAAKLADVLALQPTLTPEDMLGAFDRLTAEPMARLQRALMGSPLPQEELREIEQAAREALASMRNVLQKRLPTARATADMLVHLASGAGRNRAELDARLAPLVAEWPLERQSAPDRNILRLGAFELLHSRSTPPAVVINEAVELAKRYGTEESGRFVNGVLAALAEAEGIAMEESGE